MSDENEIQSEPVPKRTKVFAGFRSNGIHFDGISIWRV